MALPKIAKNISMVVVLIISASLIAYFVQQYFTIEKLIPVNFTLVPQPNIETCLEDLRDDYAGHVKFPKIIIENQKDYDAFISRFNNCTIKIPVDFSTSTLIGTEASSWCRAHLERKLLRDDANKIYHYVVEEKLDCSPLLGCNARSCFTEHSLNFAIIPKLPDGYRLQFDVYQTDNSTNLQTQHYIY